MLNEREMKYRLKCAEDQGVPMTNYGITIAYMQGILRRSLAVFPQLLMRAAVEDDFPRTNGPARRKSVFLLGKEVEGQEELVKEMYAAGHVIGNHTYSHVDLSGLSTTDAMAELADANEAIRNCTGEYPQFFRPPFGRISETLNSRLPMMMVLWNVDPKDWNCQDTGEIVDHIVKNVQENDIKYLSHLHSYKNLGIIKG